MTLDELMTANKEMFNSWVESNEGLNSDQLQEQFLGYIKDSLKLDKVFVLTGQRLSEECMDFYKSMEGISHD